MVYFVISPFHDFVVQDFFLFALTIGRTSFLLARRTQSKPLCPLCRCGFISSGSYKTATGITMCMAELFKGRRVHQTAIGPECVQATFDAQRCIDAHVSLEYLAVIADLLYNVIGKFFIQA